MNTAYNCQSLPNDLGELSALLDRIIAEHDDTPPAPPIATAPRAKTLVERILAERKIASISGAPNPAQAQAARPSARPAGSGCLVKGYGALPNTPSTAPQNTPNAHTLAPSNSSPSIASLLKQSTPWRKASEADKFLHAVKVAAAYDGLAFSLNLSPRQQLLTVGAADPARTFARRIQRAFKRLGVVPPFALSVETSPSGRTHVHGVIVHRGLDLDLLKASLRKAGGKIRGHAASRQLDLTAIDYAAGWCGYMLADADHTKRFLEIERVTYIADDMRRMVRTYW